MAWWRARSRNDSRMALVVCTPRSLVSSADSRASNVELSTVRVRGTRVSILLDSDSRVRDTACFIRLKRLDLELSAGVESGVAEGIAGVSFLPPKSFIMKGSKVKFSALGSGRRNHDPFLLRIKKTRRGSGELLRQ